VADLRSCAPLALVLLVASSARAEKVLLQPALTEATTWRYTVEKPAADWAQPTFDDAAWKEGASGFGTAGTPGAVISTEWSTSDIWLRTTFAYHGEAYTRAALRIHYDDQARVYLNGEQIARLDPYAVEYELVDVTEAFRANVREGDNVLAIHAEQTTGGQFIDCGVVLDPVQPTRREVTLPAITPLFDFPLRDPSICLHEGTYYLVGTTGAPTWWQTNEGIRMWRSVDLVTWEPLGFVWTLDGDATWAKAVHDGNRAVWAPEIHYLRGAWWLTYSMNYGGCGLLKSTTGKPEGPYSDVKPDGPLTPNIDASLFEDTDGAVYFVWQNGMICRMSEDMTALDGQPTHLAPEGSPQVGFEGAFLFRMDGKYVLSCAEFNHGDYDCMLATADSLLGPYSPRYLAIPHGGHNMFFQDMAGAWWSTFFGSDPRAPFTERPGLLRVGTLDDGLIGPILP
jgi:xylan 1,4-beta-xylosidase